VQVIVESQNVKIASCLASSSDQSWVTHGTARWTTQPQSQSAEPIDIKAIQKRIGTILPQSFSIDHLRKVGVSGIAFPWAVTEHYGNSQEMIVRIDADPNNRNVQWDPSSWASVLDAASSVGATVFFGDAKLRIVSQIKKVVIFTADHPPKDCYLHVIQNDAPVEDPASRSADVSIIDSQGRLLAEIRGLTLTKVDGGTKTSQGMTDLVHQMAWVPAHLSEHPLAIDNIVLVSTHNDILERYEKDLQEQCFSVLKINECKLLERKDILTELLDKNSAVVYCPGPPQPADDIASSAEKLIWEVITAVRLVSRNKLSAKCFVITNGVFAAESSTALVQGPLYGLARVISVEHSNVWGGLIDVDGSHFPILPVKYVQGRDVVRFLDGVPRVGRMRPFTKHQLHLGSAQKTLLPKPEGTYVITGGLGFLGLETCDFLIAKGARRIVIISRRALPPRSRWADAPPHLSPILVRIQAMENLGATINVVSLDMGAHDAHEKILNYLEHRSLPPVLGVIHASGVLEGSLMQDITADVMERVLSPKISGALALHRAFPVSHKLDFFILFSSIGQLVGTPGQSAYAPSNAFLDTLASHRRNQGDNAISFQWTAWRGAGMGQSDHLDFELKSAGITDITLDEGFRAWEYMSKYDVDHAVVVRSMVLDADEPVPCALLEEIAVRRPRTVASPAPGLEAGLDGNERPTSTPELRIWLGTKIRECLGSVLKINDIEDIDDRVALPDLGVDSVMTLILCQKLQSVLRVKVPQTLVWNYPTLTAMVEWFLEQF
jgi:6-methylsalicylic acid synthase